MITTLSEVKARLGITDTTYDTQITAFIDEVELEFIRETKNYFLNRKVDLLSSQFVFDSEAKTITDANADFVDEYFIAGWYFINGSVHNDGFHQVATVAETTLTLVDNPVDEDSGYPISIQLVNFPAELKSLIADIIGEKIFQEKGLQSESIGSHSVTYFGSLSNGLKQRINIYRKVYA